MEKPVCGGQCLFGGCPHEKCIKSMRRQTKTERIPSGMQILERFGNFAPVSKKGGYGIAIDVGTTTVASYLFGFAEKTPLLAVESGLNAQVKYGADVISRIKYCMDEENGTETLHMAIIKQINDMACRMLEEAGIPGAGINKLVITGNTTMLHLVEGLSPISMGMLPFTPESHFGYERHSKKLGLSILDCDVYFPPCISAFVGADIISAMLCSGFAEDATGGGAVLLDIGTNGELALHVNGKIYTAATAAGPAFEGGGISCGMPAMAGAIKNVDFEDGGIRVSTIGERAPQGICGSGIISAMALFLKAGLIDETGTITDEASRYIKEYEGAKAIFLTEDVYITQADIRNFQVAKAAIAAGLLTLLHEAGTSASGLTCCLSGGFGNFIDIREAVEVGLLPENLKAVQAIGNGAACGAARMLFEEDAAEKAGQLCKKAANVELGGNAYFSEKYMECMTIGPF